MVMRSRSRALAFPSSAAANSPSTTDDAVVVDGFYDGQFSSRFTANLPDLNELVASDRCATTRFSTSESG